MKKKIINFRFSYENKDNTQRDTLQVELDINIPQDLATRLEKLMGKKFDFNVDAVNVYSYFSVRGDEDDPLVRVTSVNVQLEAGAAYTKIPYILPLILTEENCNDIKATASKVYKDRLNEQVDLFIDHIFLIKERIKDTLKNKKLVYDTFLRTQHYSFEAVLHGIGSPYDVILIPENCNLTPIKSSSNKEVIEIVFQNYGDSTLEQELDVFDTVYKSVFLFDNPHSNEVHSIFSSWPYNILIQNKRPLDDTISQMRIKGELLDCMVVSEGGTQISHPLRCYPLGLSIKDFFTKSSLQLGSVEDDVVIPGLYYRSPLKILNTYYSSSSRSPLIHYRVTIPTGEKDPNFKGTWIETTNFYKNVYWEVEIIDFRGLFPPFENLKARLEEINITKFKLDDEITTNPSLGMFWQSIKEVDVYHHEFSKGELATIVLGYIEFLHRTVEYSKKLNELQSTIFSGTYFSSDGKLMWDSIRSCEFFNSKFEIRMSELFYKFFTEYASEVVDKSAWDYYFGPFAKRLDEDCFSNFVLNRVYGARVFENIQKNSVSADDSLVIKCDPLYRFINAAIELGISPYTLLSILKKDPWFYMYDVLEFFTPVNGKYGGKKAEDFTEKILEDVVAGIRRHGYTKEIVVQ